MAAHLIEISAAVDPGAHAVLIVDQAGWHLTPKLAIPDNITVLALPPRSPELNPVENVWQFMRDNWLSNRIFKSYEDIVALCCQAWNNLIDQPWKIMSLGMRKWAHGFRSMTVGIRVGTLVSLSIAKPGSIVHREGLVSCPVSIGPCRGEHGCYIVTTQVPRS